MADVLCGVLHGGLRVAPGLDVVCGVTDPAHHALDGIAGGGADAAHQTEQSAAGGFVVQHVAQARQHHQPKWETWPLGAGETLAQRLDAGIDPRNAALNGLQAGVHLQVSLALLGAVPEGFGGVMNGLFHVF